MHVVHRKTDLPTPPSMSPPVTEQPIVRSEQDLRDRLADARPGDIITYHIGMLARDRTPQSQILSADRCRVLGAVADRVLGLAEAGWAHPLQRRLSEERFAYLLIVRPRPRALRGAAMPVHVSAQRSEAA